MWSGVRDEASAAREQGELAKEAAESGKTLGCEMLDFILQPVAGGKLFQLLYYLLAFGLIGFFAFTVYQVAPEWMEPVTTVKTVFNEQLAYPDVFLCIPAGSMVEIYEGRRGMVFAGGSNDEDHCPVTMAFLAPDLNSQVSGEEECVGTVTAGHEDPNADLVKFGTTAVPVGNDVKELVEMLPTAEVDGTVYQSACYKFQPNKFANFDLRTAVRVIFEYSDVGNEFTPYYELFLTEPGVSPLNTRNGKTYVNASQLLSAGPGQFVLFELAVDEFKDETEGDEYFHKEYRASQTAKMNQLQGGTGDPANGDFQLGPISSTEGGVAFRFASHVVRQIHIRDKTFSEVWAEIGGLWAGAAAVMTMFFVGSGHLNKNGKKLSIFRYLPGSTRRKMLKGYAVDLTKEEQLEQSVALLMQRVAQLEHANTGRTAAGEPVPDSFRDKPSDSDDMA